MPRKKITKSDKVLSAIKKTCFYSSCFLVALVITFLPQAAIFYTMRDISLDDKHYIYAADPSSNQKIKTEMLAYKRNVVITAYSSTADQTDSTPFITASGTRTRDGIVAANFLPIGTKIRIPDYSGNKIFIVEDRMNARYYYKVDIWMPSRVEAKRFGVRWLTIEVLH